MFFSMISLPFFLMHSIPSLFHQGKYCMIFFWVYPFTGHGNKKLTRKKQSHGESVLEDLASLQDEEKGTCY